MTNFEELLEYSNSETYCPYAGKINNEWVEGTISVNYLQENFGQFSTAMEMKNATNSEGLKLFFDYLVSEGKISA